MSLAFILTPRKVKRKLAETGEITLRGKVLHEVGIKEKIFEANRDDITDIILSENKQTKSRKIKDIYIKGLNFHYVNEIMEVLHIALLKEKVKKPLKL